jgi:hypothetical protein
MKTTRSKTNPPPPPIRPSCICSLREKIVAQHEIIANDTNIHFDQIVANIPKFVQINNYVDRFHCEEFIMFVRLGHARIYRAEVR